MLFPIIPSTKADVSLDGLTDYWSFDEGSGTTAESYYGETMTLNGATWVEHEGYGYALSLDGVNDYADCELDTLPTTYTIAMWITWRDSATANERPLMLGPNDHYWSIAVDGTWNVGGDWSGSAAALSKDIWYFVAIVHNSTYVWRYENGLAVTAGAKVANVWDGGYMVKVGDSGGSNYFYGYVDELYIFGRTLSLAEINELMGSQGVIPLEEQESDRLMEIIYLVGLLGVMSVSLVLFKLKLGVVGLVWGIFGIAIAASLAGNQAVPFYPYLTLGVAVVGTLLVLYSGYEMRGA